MRQQTDDMTGLTSISVIDINDRNAAGKELRPMISLTDKKGKELFFPQLNRAGSLPLPANASINVSDGEQIGNWTNYSKNSSESVEVRKILQVVFPELQICSEARKPKDPAILAEVTGTVTLGKETKGKLRLVITPDDGKTFT